VLKNDLMLFLDEEGMPWASPSFDACTSWIFLGGSRGHPQASAIVHASSYCIILVSLHLKTSFTENSAQLISNISANKNISNQQDFSNDTYKTLILTYATVATYSQSYFSQKNSKRRSIRRKCKTWQKSVKTDQQAEIVIKEIVLLLK
jgi:hypothetical protein